jgi:indole-3-glycerol phosphate synthase
MTILDKIIAYKKREVRARKDAIPAAVLSSSTLFERSTRSLSDALKNSNTGIIAEFKRCSPSKSVINKNALVHEVVYGYENAGVCGMSILTDTHFFGGSLDDLAVARNTTDTPLLRKEFIIDPYQIYEAKAYGADVILLIAAALDKNQLSEFSSIAKRIGLEVLLEVHNKEELQRSLLPSVDLIGVNNRNLKTFDVSLQTSMELSPYIPAEFVKISESGISSPKAVLELKKYGYRGFLMGEHFMKTDAPGASAKIFIESIS